jgi:hypothetical protein
MSVFIVPNLIDAFAIREGVSPMGSVPAAMNDRGRDGYRREVKENVKRT